MSEAPHHFKHSPQKRKPTYQVRSPAKKGKRSDISDQSPLKLVFVSNEAIPVLSNQEKLREDIKDFKRGPCFRAME
jgi:hypothetical protein